MREYAIGEVWKYASAWWTVSTDGTHHVLLDEPPDLIPMQVDLSAIKPEKREKKVRKMLEAAERAGVKWEATRCKASNYTTCDVYLEYWVKGMDVPRGLWQSSTLRAATHRLVRPREWIARMEAYAERKEKGL